MSIMIKKMYTNNRIMKSYNNIGVLAMLSIAVLLLAGCKDNGGEGVIDKSGDVVHFSVVPMPVASGTAPTTRAQTDSNNSFTDRSQLGLFATYGEFKEVEYAMAENSNVAYSSVMTPDPQWEAADPNKAIRYGVEGETMNFFAYHPHTEQLNSSTELVDDGENMSLHFTLPVSQSDIFELTNADLMWGTKFDVHQSEDAVSLQFMHMLSMVSFDIYRGGGWGLEEVYIDSIVIESADMSSEATLLLSSGSLIPTSSALGAVVYADYPTSILLSDATALTCQFIVIPSDMAELTINIWAETATSVRQKYTATMPATSFTAATKKNVTVRLHKYSDSIIEISTVIIPWNVTNEIEVSGA